MTLLLHFIETTPRGRKRKRFPRKSNFVFFDETRKIIEQNNYSNQILHTMATQLDSTTTQLGENSSNYSWESSKVKQTPMINSPPLFNHFGTPIKEIPSMPTTKSGNNDQ